MPPAICRTFVFNKYSWAAYWGSVMHDVQQMIYDVIVGDGAVTSGTSHWWTWSDSIHTNIVRTWQWSLVHRRNGQSDGVPNGGSTSLQNHKDHRKSSSSSRNGDTRIYRSLQRRLLRVTQKQQYRQYRAVEKQQYGCWNLGGSSRLISSLISVSFLSKFILWDFITKRFVSIGSWNLFVFSKFTISPIAMALSVSLCLCVYVCLSVCYFHYHWSHLSENQKCNKMMFVNFYICHLPTF